MHQILVTVLASDHFCLFRLHQNCCHISRFGRLQQNCSEWQLFTAEVMKEVLACLHLKSLNSLMHPQWQWS